MYDAVNANEAVPYNILQRIKEVPKSYTLSKVGPVCPPCVIVNVDVVVVPSPTFPCGETKTVHWYRTFPKRDEALRYIRNLTGDKNYIQIKDTYSHSLFVDERELDFNDNKKPFEEQSFAAYSLEVLEIFENNNKKNKEV